MRVAATRQHPLHLQVTRNGKFLVNPNNHPDFHHMNNHHHHHHAQQQHQLHQHHHQHQQQQLLPQPTTNDETINVANVAPTVIFPTFPPFPPSDNQGLTILGDRFLLLGTAEGSSLHRCVDVQTGQQLVAKALTAGDKACEALLQAHVRLEGARAVSGIAGIVEAPAGRRYLLLEGHHGDLHAYVRARRRLREPEARRLFRQAARAVSICHENGVVLRDLKLRKFVFADEARTQLRLESLEDAVMVEESQDNLTDRRGCPAYVAPEVLRSGQAYSGKAADIWSLGVLLYTMLVGRYPFNDAEHAFLFAKISRGQFAIPDGLTPRSRCLIRSLLRKEPTERPHAEDVLRHPWLSKPLRHRQSSIGRSSSSSQDQLVPEPSIDLED